ncbi:MAG: tripartite tricarboxylate transporter TctB family protein [Neptuniibacter sp.]
MHAKTISQKDIGSILCTIALIVVGGLFYYDTTTMMDSDSFVFPRAVILMLLVIALIRVIQDVIAPSAIVREHLNSNYIRSFLLVVTLGISISLIPSLGFLTAMLIAYFSIMYLAMYEQWTQKRMWAYPVVAAIAVAALYLLFVNAFSVQFPEGSLFQS